MFDEYPDAAPFLAAIREAPDDPTHRLIFSDWLEERGDLRAAWVRDPEVWLFIQKGLEGGVDPVTQELQRLVGPNTGMITGEVIAVLKKLGPPVVNSVIAWLRLSPLDRWKAARPVLAAIRPTVLRPIPALMPLRGSADWLETYLALIELGHHGADAAPVVASLLDIPPTAEFAGRPNDPIREQVCLILADIGPAAISSIPKLVKALVDCRAGSSLAIFMEHALFSLCKQEPDALLPYISTLEAVNSRWAFDLLMNTPPGVEVWISRLLTGEVLLGNGAIHALNDIQAGQVKLSNVAMRDLIVALREPRNGPRHEVRHGVVQLLLTLGERAKEAIPALRSVLADYELFSPTGGSAEEAQTAIRAALAILDPT